jgi:hypothetical protein
MAVALLFGCLSLEHGRGLIRSSARIGVLVPFGSPWLISDMQSPCCRLATLSFLNRADP